MLATLIATFGLIANSTAVVIGAMLVAPLMGPIFGLTAGLLRGDRLLLIRATIAEVSGIAVAIAIAWLVGLMPLRPEIGSEISAGLRPRCSTC